MYACIFFCCLLLVVRSPVFIPALCGWIVTQRVAMEAPEPRQGNGRCRESARRVDAVVVFLLVFTAAPSARLHRSRFGTLSVLSTPDSRSSWPLFSKRKGRDARHFFSCESVRVCVCLSVFVCVFADLRTRVCVCMCMRARLRPLMRGAQPHRRLYSLYTPALPRHPHQIGVAVAPPPARVPSQCTSSSCLACLFLSSLRFPAALHSPSRVAHEDPLPSGEGVSRSWLTPASTPTSAKPRLPIAALFRLPRLSHLFQVFSNPPPSVRPVHAGLTRVLPACLRPHLCARVCDPTHTRTARRLRAPAPLLSLRCRSLHPPGLHTHNADQHAFRLHSSPALPARVHVCLG